MSIQIPDDLLAAYLDGDLDDAARARVERALSGDAGLAQRMARQRQLRSRLRSRAEATHRAIPLAETAQVIDLARVRAQRSKRTERPSFAVPRRVLLAVAGSLMLGLAAGFFLARLLDGANPAEYREGALQASGQLARALNYQLSAGPTADTPVRMMASFHGRTGGFCRQFGLEGRHPANGLACHEQDHWRIVTLLSQDASPMPGIGLRQSNPPLQEAISEYTSGYPLDENAESRARLGGWR